MFLLTISKSAIAALQQIFKKIMAESKKDKITLADIARNKADFEIVKRNITYLKELGSSVAYFDRSLFNDNYFLVSSLESACGYDITSESQKKYRKLLPELNQYPKNFDKLTEKQRQEITQLLLVEQKKTRRRKRKS